MLVILSSRKDNYRVSLTKVILIYIISSDIARKMLDNKIVCMVKLMLILVPGVEAFIGEYVCNEYFLWSAMRILEID